MIVYDVVLAVIEHQRDRFVDLLNQTMTSCRGEPGCLLYRFSVDLDDPTRFYLSEWCEDETALQAHVAAAPFREFVAALPELGRIVSSTARQGSLTPYKRPTR